MKQFQISSVLPHISIFDIKPLRISQRAFLDRALSQLPAGTGKCEHTTHFTKEPVFFLLGSGIERNQVLWHDISDVQAPVLHGVHELLRQLGSEELSPINIDAFLVALFGMFYTNTVAFIT